jgi:hypothetical protein
VDIPFEEVAPAIVHDVVQWATAINSEHRSRQIWVLREGLELVLTFAFHQEIIPVLDTSGLFVGLATLANILELRSPLVRLLYQCFALGNARPPPALINCLDILITTATTACQEQGMSRVVLAKLSLDGEFAGKIAQSPLFTPENLRSIIAGEDGSLLRMVRNVVEVRPELIRGLETELITAGIAAGRDQTRLSDLLSIMNCTLVTEEAAQTLFAKKQLVQLLIDVLKSRNAPPQLYLEVVMFLSGVCLTEDIADTMHRLGIVDLLMNVFLTCRDDMEIQVQCLFAFYRLMPYDQPRGRMMKRVEIFPVIAQLAISPSQVVSRIGWALIEAIEVFDPQLSARLRLPMFDSFNEEWMQATHQTHE